jgi:hypothetical protein
MMLSEANQEAPNPFGKSSMEPEIGATTNPTRKDEESSCTNMNTPEILSGVEYKNDEREFDVGVKAWLQVLGAFFLYFNSWYTHQPFFYP